MFLLLFINMSTIIIKSGTTAIAGSTVKGDFSYFSANTTTDLGPTSTTGLYAGLNAVRNGYSVYQIGGPSGITVRGAATQEELNSILISAGATGTTVDENITWANNSNSVWINSGSTEEVFTYVYYGGDFTTSSGVTNNHMSKWKIGDSGSTILDPSFNIGSGFNTTVYSIVPDLNGKLMVGGFYGTFSGQGQNRLIRLNTDGSKDTSFNIGSGFNSTGVFSLEFTPDGKIYVGGFYSTFSGVSQNNLVRLNSDGTKDASFDIGTGFNEDVYALWVDANGKIYVGGYYISYKGLSQNHLIRLNSDGTKDAAFNIGTGFDYPDGSPAIYVIKPSLDGKIYVGGSFTTYKGVSEPFFVKLNTDGSVDTAFNSGGAGFDSDVNTITIDANGKIYVGGVFTTYNGTSSPTLIRLNSDGSRDTGFNVGTGCNGAVNSVEIGSDGLIYVGGNFTTYNGQSVSYNVILNTDGRVNNKKITFNNLINDVYLVL